MKHCRINGPRARAREVMRPPKARLEFENAARLLALGIGAAVPLAWGTADSIWPGESFLVTRDLAPAIPFTDFVEVRVPTFTPDDQCHMRRQLARGLGRFMAHLHDSGVMHPDPHPGNVLIEVPPSLVPHFSLLDVHAVRFGAPLSWAESCANLILFNRWFQLRRLPRPIPDAASWRRGTVWRGRTLPDRGGRAPAKRLPSWSARHCASNRRFLDRPHRGTPGNAPHDSKKVRGLRAWTGGAHDLPEEFVRENCSAIRTRLFTRPGVRLLKQCVSSTVAELEMPTPAAPACGHSEIARELSLRARSGEEPVPSVNGNGAVVASWGTGCASGWLPTPRSPLAMFHRYRAGFLPAEGVLAHEEKVPDAVGLSEAVKGVPRYRGVLRAWAERLARVVRANARSGCIAPRPQSARTADAQGCGHRPGGRDTRSSLIWLACRPDRMLWCRSR